ncbi:hypothetical protein DFH11DRAFT_688792 [Phellopilus nigrolimitatus]|nr:hypothetical protein DFH11DRAFT_688792 [Phellopilus nigrolimitatus]
MSTDPYCPLTSTTSSTGFNLWPLFWIQYSTVCFLSSTVMASLDLSKLKYEISMEEDLENPDRFKDVAFTASYPGHAEPVAQLNAILIKRFEEDDHFIQVMDEKSDEMQKFAIAVFDKFGQVKPWLIHNDYHRGSGAWGEELNIRSPLLYVVELKVVPEFQRKGVGSRALQRLIESTKNKDFGHVPYLMCWPTPTAHSIANSEWSNAKSDIIQFYRKNGFRRIGRTTFFGYATSETHPSRLLAASDDCNGHWTPPPADEDQPGMPPIHAAIAAAAMAGMPPYNTMIGLADKANSDMLSSIRNAQATKSDALHAQDESGMTPLHVAASTGSLRGVQELLVADDPATFADLKRRDNEDGVTPLEASEKERISSRELSEALLGRWKGYEDNRLKIEWEIREKLGWEDGLGLVPLPAGTRLTWDAYLKRRKFADE